LELLKIEPDRWIVTSAIYPSQNPVSIDILW
jgi:hypothetical protein